MPLLEANTHSVPPANTNGSEIIGSLAMNNIVADNALMPATGPLGTSDGVDLENFSDDISIYVVRSGDTLSQVATMFGVSVDTILSANDMQKGDKLKEGDVLLILPFSGVEHTVTKGETLQGIASKYKVDIEDILSANDLDSGTKLVIGEKLMVPGADLLNEKPKGSTSNIAGKVASKVPSVAGYFVNPVPGAIKSRGVKPGHKGVDLAAKTGTPIRAGASGTVLIARNGYNGGFGNYVVIQHPNGVKTLYAHMSKLGTNPGAKVSQGQTIGYVGSTGHSTGPHLHFEVIGAKNPF
jgi:LysM repeat protein